MELWEGQRKSHVSRSCDIMIVFGTIMTQIQILAAVELIVNIMSFCLYFGTTIAIITKAFQGSMRIFSKKLPHPDLVSLILFCQDSFLLG